MVFLKEIMPFGSDEYKHVMQFILQKGKTTMEGLNKTCLVLMPDETAAVHFQLWGDECDAFEPADIVNPFNKRYLLLKQEQSCF